ncbi:hypothetical protein ACSQ76_16465 [Roseovarius sp. B08]|uniref:hypothetical protein n=1 Tax=Roseovarius sp. B08 TaxID=3449223 RepID=UPI003EDC8598
MLHFGIRGQCIRDHHAGGVATGFTKRECRITPDRGKRVELAVEGVDRFSVSFIGIDPL